MCSVSPDRIDIVGWCELPGALATWNIFRRGFGEEQEHAPDLVLDHSRCPTAENEDSDIVASVPRNVTHNEAMRARISRLGLTTDEHTRDECIFWCILCRFSGRASCVTRMRFELGE